MKTAFSFGSPYPGTSFIHRLDPRAKLLFGCIYMGIILAAQDFAQLGVIAAFGVLMYAVSRIPVGNALKSLAPLLVIALLAAVLNLFTVQTGSPLVDVGFIHITTGGARSCAFIACRITLMMLGMSLVTMTTMTLDLTEGIEKILGHFKRFGMPAHEIGMIFGIALRFLPQFATEFVLIRQAQISRGADLAGSPVKGVRMVSSLLIPLFTSVFRHAETLSAAMDARCYHGADGRTEMHPLSYSRRDALVLACLIALGIAIGAMNVLR